MQLLQPCRGAHTPTAHLPGQPPMPRALPYIFSPQFEISSIAACAIGHHAQLAAIAQPDRKPSPHTPQ